MQDTIAQYYTAYEGSNIVLNLVDNDDFQSRVKQQAGISRFSYIKLYS